jgi:hypothetical protein
MLQRLKPAEMDASFRQECLPGTRLDILNEIANWATDPSMQHIWWLYGLAGSGKSTISTTIANTFRDLGRLGAFIFYNRDTTDGNDSAFLIRTLAYQLGTFDSRIGDAISIAITNNLGLIQSPFRVQFLKLLVEPVSSVLALRNEGPIVIVVDALDECGDLATRKLMLEVIANESAKLPSIFRIFITSRAEYDITRAFDPQHHILARELDIASSTTASDISKFLQHHMAIIRTRNLHLKLGADWPGDEVIRKLTDRASGLFIWASTASRFVDGHNPEKRLRLLLLNDSTSGAESSLDTLYETALVSVGMWDDSDFVTDFQAILGTMLAARIPLSGAAIDKLLGANESRPSIHTTSLLGCIIRQQPNLRLLHPSFADFLSDQLRCRRDAWFIDVQSHNRGLAIRCLVFLETVLKRNICRLALSPATVDESLP